MVNTMEVDDLKIVLSKRGLHTSGTKRILVKRLTGALLEESNGSKPDGVVETEKGKKRERENSDGVSDETSKIEKYQAMSIQKLRKDASCRGILTSGSKKELIQELCAADKDGSIAGNEKDEKKAVEEVKKDKLVTAIKKGSGVLDQWLSDKIKSRYHVLEIGNEIYDAVLNQTNVGKNNNKFYVIQVLEKDDGRSYRVYNRWGRVGVKGSTLSKLHPRRETAIREFEQKFLEKTKNHWSNRKDFVSYPNSYTWIEMDYEPGRGKPSASCTSRQLQETKLDQRVAKFISLICNIGMMKQQMMEIGYNADKLPLGKLSKATILKGYKVLKRIADVIGNSDRELLEQLSGDFYEIIPHNFGFEKTVKFVIDSPEKLKHELEMVEALGEIKLATRLLHGGLGMEEDPLHAQYERLRCQLVPVDVSSEEFSMIETYTKNTHAKTHSSYTVEIAQVFRVSRDGENKRFKKFASTENRMLLWHGSRLTNWTGILSQGLRIAPPEAPATGYMFGKGVYFADMFSKSANYSHSSSSPAGVLLLCEVALGEMNELQYATSDTYKLPAGKLSTKGVGGTAPDFSKCRVLEDGVVVPLAKPVEKKVRKGRLLYNEYIVYNVDQIRMRYVIQVNFKF